MGMKSAKMKPITVKQEKGTPWAHELVVQDGEVVRVKQESQSDTPWEVPKTKNSRHPVRIPDAPDERMVWQATEDTRLTGDAKKTRQIVKPNRPEKPKTRSTRFISAKNYAAVDAESKAFGLIPTDMPGGTDGLQHLIMHAPRGVPGWKSFQEVRPGALLRVVKNDGKDRTPIELQVRFTTPTRYIPPGAKISCMTIGVDGAEWKSLMSNPRRI